jgi:hypothetical protein
MAAASRPPPQDFAPDDGLSQIERDILGLCARAAADGRQLESIEEMMGMFGFSSYSTIPGIMRRLEAKGFITRRIFQRGRQVCITATGQCSAPPACTAPHWRLRAETPPTPPVQQVRQKWPSLSAAIEQEARQLRKPMTDFLADLVYIGWHEFQAEAERARAPEAA